MFKPLKILEQVDRRLISVLSKEQLELLLLLVASAAKNNGKGKLERETIGNFADVCFNGEDLFVLCQNLMRFGYGRLTCCREDNPKTPPCLTDNWKNLPIGVIFWTKQKRKKKCKNIKNK